MTAVRRLLSRQGEPTLRERRTLVVLSALAIAGTGILMLSSPRGPGALVVLALALVLLVPLYILQEFRRNVFKRANADERERGRRDEAYRLAYRVIEYSMPLVALVFAISPYMQLTNWHPVWFAAMGYVFFLPYMVFAWREPDSLD